jgi:hypothetical protein
VIRPRPVSVRFQVAGVSLAVRASRPRACLRTPVTHRPFLSSRGSDIVLDLCDDAPPHPPESDLAFDSEGPWRVFRLDNGWFYQFLAEERGGWRLAESVVIDQAIRRGRLYPDPVQPRRFALTYPVDELLFHHHLALDGHVVLHACGVVVGRKAALVCGESGAGKSTVARLWARMRGPRGILSDDRIVVRNDAGRFKAFGTPWHGETRFAVAAGYSLGAVFFLKQARHTEVERLDTLTASGQLFARSFPPVWRRETVTSVLDTCAEIAGGIPCYELRFSPDGSAVDVIQAAML